MSERKRGRPIGSRNRESKQQFYDIFFAMNYADREAALELLRINHHAITVNENNRPSERAQADAPKPNGADAQPLLASDAEIAAAGKAE